MVNWDPTCQHGGREFCASSWTTVEEATLGSVAQSDDFIKGLAQGASSNLNDPHADQWMQGLRDFVTGSSWAGAQEAFSANNLFGLVMRCRHSEQVTTMADFANMLNYFQLAVKVDRYVEHESIYTRLNLPVVCSSRLKLKGKALASMIFTVFILSIGVPRKEKKLRSKLLRAGWPLA